MMGQDGVQAGKVKCGSTVPDADDICWLGRRFILIWNRTDTRRICNA
jgi:hypothetical protein